MDVVRRHARELINSRLAPARPAKDGWQTCLQINHGITKGHKLSERERRYVVDITCRWIENEARAGRGPRRDPPLALS
ncbi:hypothetical protein [Streptomyces albidoflavus]|uniref:hypothetical protein n=1 Tax=Streptomyces albidoflavus TaxID=1886 RepID=UPI001A90D3AD|nr:hypothetical protein [Streptomyces albidoflavus]